MLGFLGACSTFTICMYRPQSSQQQSGVYADILLSDDRPIAPPTNEPKRVVHAEVAKTAGHILVGCTTTFHTVSERVNSM